MTSRSLSALASVAVGYRHGPKTVVAGEPLELPTAELKWYQLHPVERPVPDEVAATARAALTSGALEVNGLGFVVLHRCGADFYFLIACTWRNENELWQTVWYRDGSMTAFAPFARPATHLPTFCVWELAPVHHEQQAWTRFLLSARDEAAAQRWRAERCSGPA